MRAADLLFRCRDDILFCEKLASVCGENVFLPLIIRGITYFYVDFRRLSLLQAEDQCAQCLFACGAAACTPDTVIGAVGLVLTEADEILHIVGMLAVLQQRGHARITGGAGDAGFFIRIGETGVEVIIRMYERAVGYGLYPVDPFRCNLYIGDFISVGQHEEFWSEPKLGVRECLVHSGAVRQQCAERAVLRLRHGKAFLFWNGAGGGGEDCQPFFIYASLELHVLVIAAVDAVKTVGSFIVQPHFLPLRFPVPIFGDEGAAALHPVGAVRGKKCAGMGAGDANRDEQGGACEQRSHVF